MQPQISHTLPTVSHGTTIGVQQTNGRWRTRNGRGIIQHTVRPGRRDTEKPMKEVSFRSKIWTQDLQNMKRWWRKLSSLRRLDQYFCISSPRTHKYYFAPPSLTLTQTGRQCAYNVTIRRVSVTNVAVEKQNVLHILCVCVNSLSYPARKAHATYYIVICGLSGFTLFLHITCI